METFGIYEAIPYLVYLHGAYNLGMAVSFLFMLRLGLKARRGRLEGSAPAQAQRLHRRMGPVFAPLGVAGFFAGAIIMYLDRGTVFFYPIHFVFGLLIASLITTTFVVSRKIRGESLTMRTLHFRIGLSIIVLYALQITLGIAILFA